MLEGNIYILHEVLEGKVNSFMHDDDDDDEGPLHFINESYVHLSFISMILLQTKQYLWNLNKTIGANETHVCIDEHILMYSKCTSVKFTLRKVKAVHLSSSVPSGDSMRPVKQAFQISRTNRAVGIFCGGQTISY